MKQRIWELDGARGLCLLGMIGFHLWYDLVFLFALVPMQVPRLFRLISDWGAVPFFLISGICATLGSRPVRRGLQVLCGALAVSAATAGLYFLQLAGREILIPFGILHCLGCCMLLWALLHKLPALATGTLSVAMLTAGLWLRYRFRADIPWLIPLGVIPSDFASADYFPLLPYAGFFLLSALAGRRLYAHRRSLLPRVDTTRLPIRFLTFLGRHALSVYLLHQPVLLAGLTLWTLIF